VQVALCSYPALLAVQAGEPTLGSRWFFLSAFALLGLNLLFAAPPTVLALILGLLPGAMFLRDLFVYNSVIVMLAIGVGYMLLRSASARQILRRPDFVYLFCFSALYWLLSYAFTGLYYSNLRIWELSLAAASVAVLLPFREHLATALFGVLLGLGALAMGTFGYGDRLGYAEVDGVLLGNPISFGVPLLLLLLLALADGGRWLLLHQSPGRRAAVTIMAGALLLLSNSRASWAAAALSLGLLMLLNRRQRRVVVIYLALLVLVAAVVVHTSRGATVIAWYGRTFNADRSLLQKTSGRSDQWLLMPKVMALAPPWGYGPGSGPAIYARFSLLDPRVSFRPGQEMAWHSLYQQVAVETGLVGSAVLLLFIAYLLRLGYRWWQLTGEVMPLLGTISFLVLVATVSGADPASGLFVGFGLVPGALLGESRRPAGRRLVARSHS
jgi:O-antigen ligase